MDPGVKGSLSGWEPALCELRGPMLRKGSPRLWGCCLGMEEWEEWEEWEALSMVLRVED